MGIRSWMTGALLALLCLGTGVAASASQVEGTVTSYSPGQIVVCTFDGASTCTMVHIYGGTRTVSASSGRRVSLARGEYVSVDTRVSSGMPYATLVHVYTNRAVRSIKGFHEQDAQHVTSVLNGIQGVRQARVNPSLGEVMLTFSSSTSPDAIERAAARRGIHLALPG